MSIPSTNFIAAIKIIHNAPQQTLKDHETLVHNLVEFLQQWLKSSGDITTVVSLPQQSAVAPETTYPRKERCDAGLVAERSRRKHCDSHKESQHVIGRSGTQKRKRNTQTASLAKAEAEKIITVFQKLIAETSFDQGFDLDERHGTFEQLLLHDASYKDKNKLTATDKVIKHLACRKMARLYKASGIKDVTRFCRNIWRQEDRSARRYVHLGERYLQLDELNPGLSVVACQVVGMIDRTTDESWRFLTITLKDRLETLLEPSLRQSLSCRLRAVERDYDTIIYRSMQNTSKAAPEPLPSYSGVARPVQELEEATADAHILGVEGPSADPHKMIVRKVQPAASVAGTITSVQQSMCSSIQHAQPEYDTNGSRSMLDSAYLASLRK